MRDTCIKMHHKRENQCEKILKIKNYSMWQSNMLSANNYVKWVFLLLSYLDRKRKEKIKDGRAAILFLDAVICYTLCPHTQLSS